MRLESPDFKEGKRMPFELTCDGAGISPTLSVRDVPPKAKSLALTMDDPDAPGNTWDHWVVFNIDPTTNIIEKNSEPNGTPGLNSWGRTGYGGPCPPSGSHRYFFKLYALDRLLDLKGGTGKPELLRAMESHIISEAQLMGRYERKKK